MHAFKQRAVELADDSTVSAKVHRCCGLLRFAAARDRLCSPGPAFYTSHGVLTALRSVGLAVAGDSTTFPDKEARDER